MRATSGVVVALFQVIVASNVQCRLENNNTTSFVPDAGRWPKGLHLGVDYYPSQWPEWMWESDVARMRDSNITLVRVNEFDWSVLEPREGEYNFTLLDKTLNLFDKHGLKAIVGTPTASPPNWLAEKYDTDFVDRTNTTLLFGSRRHYSFSSFDYREQSQKITTKLAERYGNSSVIAGWQLDNEFGCHDTVRSYDHNAKIRFRAWLEQKYGSIEKLNEAQGRVFWSSQYASFEAVQPPFLVIYTTNEAHTLDWYQFSSDMVIEFAKEQAAILRRLAPAHAITTNFMVLFTDFNHYKFNREVGLDLTTFDSYPLAASWSEPECLRTGLPDMQALNHALYRGVAGAAYGKNHGPFGVMEMQPGVLNWSPYRVSPANGMVRLWTHETFAASGDMVTYFRWRQVPFAQEQTLSGLFTSDDVEDAGYIESQNVAGDLSHLQGVAEADQADVALIFDYTSSWIGAIEPYSGTWSVKDAGYTDPTITYTDLVYTFHSALRRLGVSVDIIGPDQALEGYKMIVVPSLPIIPDSFGRSFSNFTRSAVFGPHTGSRTPTFAYVPGLNPSSGALRSRLPMRVSRIETPLATAGSGIEYGGTIYNISGWEEWIECARGGDTSTASVKYTSPHRPGKPAACVKNKTHYLAFNPSSDVFLVAYLADVATEAGVQDVFGREVSKGSDLGPVLRFARRGDLLWGTNYGSVPVSVPNVDGEVVIGEEGDLEAYGVRVWKMR